MEEGTLLAKSDIKKVTLSDGIERDYIDSYPKLIRIVKEKIEKRKKDFPKEEPVVVLSKMIIAIWGPDSSLEFSLNDLLSYLKDVGCVLENESDTEIFCQVKSKILFDDTIIFRANFVKATFFNDVTFHKTKFISYAYFRNSVFNGKVTFKGLEFEFELNEQDKKILDLYKNQSWSNSLGEETIEVYINNAIDFTDSVFNNDVCFKGARYFTTRNKSICEENEFNLLSNIILNGSHFNKKLKINYVNIGGISMQNCHFKDTVNISNNKYNTSSSLDFAFSTINSLLIIDSDLGNDKGEPIILENEISFEKSLITKDAFILIRNIKKGDDAKKQGCLNFKYANILGTVTIQDSKLDSIKLEKSTLIGDINIENVETDYDSRESIVKVKNSYLKRNDVINSLTYKAKEMNFYCDELSKCFSCTFSKIKKLKFIDLIKKYFMTLKLFRFIVKNLWSFIKFVLLKCILLPLVILPIGILLSIIPSKSLEKVREYTLLYLNRISNSFGMSWGRGVLFTCVTALLFFILINYKGMSAPFSENIPKGENCFGYLWKNYLHMFYLLDFKDKFSEGIELNALGDTLFFVSKIFVSYGIYQTISAFRKYGK